MIYNTCLTPENQYVSSRKDYAGEGWEMERFAKSNSFFRYEHVHRRWEYGLCACLINEFKPKSLLNVGGGNSPVSAWALDKGIDVTEIDPNPPSVRLPGIKYIDENFPTNNQTTYEMVVCTSVIEHVPDNDVRFFDNLLTHSSKSVFLTTDFHPSGKAFSYAHYRTYNMERMMDFINRARLLGFMPYGSIHYKYDGPMVYDYTFAALALHRKKPTHV